MLLHTGLVVLASPPSAKPPIQQCDPQSFSSFLANGATLPPIRIDEDALKSRDQKACPLLSLAPLLAALWEPCADRRLRHIIWLT